MKPEEYRIRRIVEIALTLLFAPLAVALMANIVTNIGLVQAIPPWLFIASFLSVLIALVLVVLVYTHKLDDAYTRLDRRLRSRRFRNPRVLILDGRLEGESQEKYPAPKQSNKAPAEWQTALERFGWHVELEPVRRLQQVPLPDIVINPFGELYPESHPVLHSTALQIRDYVSNGGVYVNIAGNPFWYRYDPRTGVNREEVAGWMKRIFNRENSFIWIPLFQDLFPYLKTSEGDTMVVESMQTQQQLDRFGGIQDAGNSRQVTQFRSYPSDSGQMISLLYDSSQTQCIIGSFPFGKGFYLFAGVCIDSKAPNFEKVIAAIKGWVDYESRGRKP